MRKKKQAKKVDLFRNEKPDKFKELFDFKKRFFKEKILRWGFENFYRVGVENVYRGGPFFFAFNIFRLTNLHKTT